MSIPGKQLPLAITLETFLVGFSDDERNLEAFGQRRERGRFGGILCRENVAAGRNWST